MEKVDGVILRTPAELAELSGERRAPLFRGCLVDVLVAIHGVDYHAVGLDEFGHPDGYLERQVRRWGEQWERSKSRELPAIEELARRLRAALPASPAPTIVHGDYRLDNTMLAPDDSRPHHRGARLGDGDARRSALRPRPVPRVLGSRSEQPRRHQSVDRPRGAGFLSRQEVAERYANASGRDVSQLDFYEMLASYKLAIILEGIHARFLMGKTVGEGFDHIGVMVETIADAALDSASRSSIPALRG